MRLSGKINEFLLYEKTNKEIICANQIGSNIRGIVEIFCINFALNRISRGIMIKILVADRAFP